MAGQLVVLSGPPNAGKSATAKALCERYDRMLHIEVGVLRDFLRMGRLRPWDRSPDGMRQHALLVSAACDMARRFLQAGYGVIIEDIVTEDDLPVYAGALGDVSASADAGSLEPASASAHFVVILPALDVLLERERSRPTEWRLGGRLQALHARFSAWRDVFVLDPGDLAPDLVADRVMAQAAAGTASLAAAAS